MCGVDECGVGWDGDGVMVGARVWGVVARRRERESSDDVVEEGSVVWEEFWDGVECVCECVVCVSCG